MKNTALFAIMIGFVSVQASAKMVTLLEREVELTVDISAKNVKWSKADYSAPVVKILVPELADVTLLDHRNRGEGAPCLASYETKSPADVIQNNPAVEKAKFTVTLQKELTLDQDQKNCEVRLIELVNGEIRGHKFQHEKFLPVGSRHIDDCR